MSLKSILHLAAAAVGALVAGVWQFGYPLVIALALVATFVALTALVGLTSLDVIPRGKPAAKSFTARRLAVRGA
jgi:hypothetical protein